MFCTEEKERRICRSERASEREERCKGSATTPAHQPSVRKQTALPPLSDPARPQKNPCPENSPSTPTKEKNKKKNPQSTHTSNVQVFHKIFKFFLPK